MSERSTEEWIEDDDALEKVFGKFGVIGDKGEQVVAEYLRNDGASVIVWSASQVAQVECKIDLAFRYPEYKNGTWITVDVKSQEAPNQPKDTFRVNYKRLVAAQENGTVDRWWHVDLLSGAMAYYDVAEFVGFLNRCMYLVPIKRYYNDLLIPKSVFKDYGFRWIDINGEKL